MSDERLERLTSRTAAIIRAERRSEIASLPHTKDSLDRDVRTLLAALDREVSANDSLQMLYDAEKARVDAQGEHNAITHACWVADRTRAEAAERGLAELRAFATYHARVYGLHGLALKQLQEAVAGTSPLLAEIAALPKEATP